MANEGFGGCSGETGGWVLLSLYVPAQAPSRRQTALAYGQAKRWGINKTFLKVRTQMLLDMSSEDLNPGANLRHPFKNKQSSTSRKIWTRGQLLPRNVPTSWFIGRSIQEIGGGGVRSANSILHLAGREPIKILGCAFLRVHFRLKGGKKGTLLGASHLNLPGDGHHASLSIR